MIHHFRPSLFQRNTRRQGRNSPQVNRSSKGSTVARRAGIRIALVTAVSASVLALVWFTLGLAGGYVPGRTAQNSLIIGATFTNTTWTWIYVLLMVITLLTGALGWLIFARHK